MMGTSKSPPVHHLTFSSILTSTREARLVFKAGKNFNGYFTSDDLLAQVDNTIDIFEGLTKGQAQGLFVFDNVPSHQKCVQDAISAQHMTKGVLNILVLTD